jgi:hypothetical protein
MMLPALILIIFFSPSQCIFLVIRDGSYCIKPIQDQLPGKKGKQKSEARSEDDG